MFVWRCMGAGTLVGALIITTSLEPGVTYTLCKNIRYSAPLGPSTMDLWLAEQVLVHTALITAAAPICLSGKQLQDKPCYNTNSRLEGAKHSLFATRNAG